MATVEMIGRSTEGDQEEKILPPSEDDSPPVLNNTTAPLNFSDLTPCQFGISVQSFTPAASLSNGKDKSRLAQMKARRRSNIGVRGSPETNSLIRFMAQQKMKNPRTVQTPEPVRSSPFLPRVASTLRQKMASFQNLMDMEESEVCEPMPKQDCYTGGCIKTRDYLSDGNSCDRGKENHPSLMTPTPTKRRRVGPLETCQLEIRETSTPILHLSLKEQKSHPQEDEVPVMQVGTQGPRPSSETVEEAQALPISPSLHLYDCSSPEHQEDSVFEVQRASHPPPNDPAATSPGQPASSFHIPSVPSQLEMKPTEEDDSTGKSTLKGKKKSVRFGGPLSPEFFDKNLPPSTPLQKGGTPARAPTPGGVLHLRPLLKTPQRSESQTLRAQPDLYSPDMSGASPALSMSRNGRIRSVGEEGDENDGEIVFPSMEENDSALTHETECAWDTQPLNLNIAFHNESLSQMATESEAQPSTTSQMDEITSRPEQEKPPETAADVPATRRNRRTKPGPVCESTSEAPSSRKRKQPEESEPVKRSTRSAAKSASGKIKTKSAANRRWNKDVDRSLYSSRAYASKNPTLSPITERLSFISHSASEQQTPPSSCTAPNHVTSLNLVTANSSETIGDPTLTNTVKCPVEDSSTFPSSSRESTIKKGRRLSGRRVTGRRLQKKVSVADCVLVCETLEHAGGKAEEQREDQTTTNPQASRETPLTLTGPEQGGEDIELSVQTSADTRNRYGTLEDHGVLEAPASDFPPSGDELNNTLSHPSEPTQRLVKRGRRNSVSSLVLQEQGNQAEEHQTSHEMEKEKGEQAACCQENVDSSPGSQEDVGPADLNLAPWQADFNFEDVFKPVATRGQSSVRRSLRNQSNAEHRSNSAGLAWLPRTSPDSSKEARRRTRGRRASAAPPAQPSLPEDMQDEA